MPEAKGLAALLPIDLYIVLNALSTNCTFLSTKQTKAYTTYQLSDR